MRLFMVVGLLIANVSPVSCIYLYFSLLMISDFGRIFACGQFPTFTVYMPLLLSLVICGIFVSSCGLFFSA